LQQKSKAEELSKQG